MITRTISVAMRAASPELVGMGVTIDFFGQELHGTITAAVPAGESPVGRLSGFGWVTITIDPPDEPVPPPCSCGHTAAEHHRGTGACMASTASMTWACDCGEYQDPTSPPTQPL